MAIDRLNDPGVPASDPADVVERAAIAYSNRTAEVAEFASEFFEAYDSAPDGQEDLWSSALAHLRDAVQRRDDAQVDLLRAMLAEKPAAIPADGKVVA